ncbi:Nif3-like dinuclear metal center hexameric protein [Petroclostridium sp. X23]|uniref:Nif3-like dinuclear metal center hexameric protein n=1 Tax=Petroclostridium sp. X23 TaxID=3045146 RepID=UPI0024ADED12|nr:Nif3-like dinuclear metal center hexameric protein [Petroclostridium sp. X23]WHH59566.1 Nif3-like dinuclear metal center hexameric protein [Petroclostridium sp. X23]
MTKCKDIMGMLEQLAPIRLAENWDNVGLLLGDREQPVNHMMVTLDVTMEVVQEAVKKKVNMIIAHHPFIFKPLKAVVQQDYLGAMVRTLIKNDIAVYAAHTNLDICQGGLNDILADKMNLKNIQVLDVLSRKKLNKIVAFVPVGYEDAVRQTMTSAGAGWIGNYSDCTYMTGGTGTFKPLEGTNPFIGKQGKVEKTEEYRLETVAPAEKVKDIIQAMIEVHPYEEVAYDVYPLEVEGDAVGLGRIGYLEEPTPFHAFISSLKKVLGIQYVKCVGDENKLISTVALCTGSGGDFISSAIQKRADVYITGDIKYHQAQLAQQAGINLIDAGHYETENIVVPYLIEYLSNKCKDADVKISASERNDNILQVK